MADAGRVMRFDLTADPGELAPVDAEAHRAASRLTAHCRALDDAYRARPTLDPKLDAEITEQLKALGYLRDEEP